MLKNCAICHTDKPVEDFSPQTTGRMGRFGYCKECYNAKRRNDPEIRKQRRTYARGRHHILKSEPEYKAARRERRILHRYGLSISEYDWLFSLHDGCWLCGELGAKDVDHDHSRPHSQYRSGCRECIRGVLCNSCNRYLLPPLERHPHLQGDVVREYLKHRPFKERLHADNSSDLGTQ